MSSLISLNSNSLRRFGRQMRAAGAEVEGQIRGGLAAIAAVAAGEAKSNASWSKRIPGSIRSGATRSNAYVRAGGAKAPHAPAYENHGRQGTFRHPVFGNREVWVDQKARPFLASAVHRTVDAEGESLAEAIRKTVERN